MVASLESRIDRLESLDAIRQLPARYALALDGRDMDAWAALFLEDGQVFGSGRGRDAIKAHIEPLLRRFYRSIHTVMNHVIEFDDADNARGYVYCRAEHEDRAKWVIMAIVYEDVYQRRNGEWFFVNRHERHWYTADVLDRPTDVDFHGWDGFPVKPNLPHRFSEWSAFWDRAGVDAVAKVTNSPL